MSSFAGANFAISQRHNSQKPYFAAAAALFLSRSYIASPISQQPYLAAALSRSSPVSQQPYLAAAAALSRQPYLAAALSRSMPWTKEQKKAARKRSKEQKQQLFHAMGRKLLKVALLGVVR